MLVLTRKRHEAVIVGGRDASQCMVKVTVLDIGGGKVRLGFEAPADLPVHRLEVWREIQATGRSTRLVKPSSPVA